LIAIAGWHEAITGAIAAGLIAAAAAVVFGVPILRLRGLALLMVTLALGVIAYEVANQASWLTGGDNGLMGITIAPLLGVLHWSVYGQTAYLYALAWLFLLFWVARRLVSSPFGVALQGVRENHERMSLVGASVPGHLLRVFVVSAFMAGVAGAVLAQTAGLVGLQVFSIDNSVDVLVMLVLGGIGRLYGALLGAAVYVVLKDFAAEWNPYHWMFVVGGLLVIVVRFAEGGLLGMADRAAAWARHRLGFA
jgi:branched-chain amino acid transport system permease protein